MRSSGTSSSFRVAPSVDGNRMASNHSMSKVAPADVEQMSSLADRIASLEKEVKTVRGSGHSAGNDEGGDDESPPESPYSWSFGALLDANARIGPEGRRHTIEWMGDGRLGARRWMDVFGA